MGRVHDDVAGLQLQRVDDVAPARRELLDHPRVAADGAAVELALGEHGQPRLGQLEPALQRCHDEVGEAGLRRVADLLDAAGGDPPLGQHVARTVDQALTGCGDHDAPAVGDERADVRRRTLDIALERGHRLGPDADDAVVVGGEPLGGGVGRTRIERRQAPPDAVALVRGLAQPRQGEEVPRAEVDGNARAGGRSRPGRVEELAVGLTEGEGAADGALGVDEGDRRAGREELHERGESVHEHRAQGLHALDGDALRHPLEHRAHARELVPQRRGPRPHVGGEEEFAARQERHALHDAGERALVGDGERTDGVDLVAEELHTQRVVGRRREDVEDAAADGELAATRHHVHAVIGQLHETHRHALEVVPPSADDEVDGIRVAEPARDGLQGAAHRGGEHERSGPVPGRKAPEHRDPPADGLRARAEPLVGQGLPRREVAHFGAGQEGLQRRAQTLRTASGGRDDEQDARLPGSAAAFQHPGEDGSGQPVDERELGIGGGEGGGILERFGLLEGAHDPGNCHCNTLPAPSDAEAAGGVIGARGSAAAR